jgi:hypothetical protein
MLTSTSSRPGKMEMEMGRNNDTGTWKMGQNPG